MPSPSSPIWIAVCVGTGGALGALLRFAIHAPISRMVWPPGITAVNLIGCGLAGLILGLTLHSPLSAEVRAFTFFGFLGALTTMSGFAVEVTYLVREQYYLRAIVHAAGGTLLCCLATVVFMSIGAWISSSLID